MFDKKNYSWKKDVTYLHPVSYRTRSSPITVLKLGDNNISPNYFPISVNEPPEQSFPNMYKTVGLI